LNTNLIIVFSYRANMLMQSVYVLLIGLCYASIFGIVSSSEAHPGYDSGKCDVGISASRDQGRILDISHAYREDMPVWDSSEGLGHCLWLAGSMKNGSIANNSEMKMGTHTGTHVDAPGHVFQEYYEAGFDVDTLDLKILNGHALLVDVPRDTNITAKAMEGLNIPRGVHRVLFRTLNTDRHLMWRREFDTSYVGFMKDGAQWLVDNTDIKFVGIDYLSVAAYDDLIPSHLVFLKSKEIILVEGLKLDDIDPGVYSLHCLPLRLLGAEGSPIRCVLMDQILM